MSRIVTHSSIETSPERARPLLEAVQKQLGSVPNLFRVVANSPAALEGYLGLNFALAKGALPAATRERIALAVAELNGCEYCLAAHSYIGSHMAKLSDDEIRRAREGGSADAKADAAVRFAVAVARNRGRVDDAALEAARAAGHGDAELVEIVAHVALNVLTNYVNNAAGTEVDFPKVRAPARAA